MIELTKKQMQIFDGLMISDGYIEKCSKNARFGLTTSKKEFAEKVASIFPNFPWSNPSIKTRDVYDKRTGKSYSSTVIRSRIDEFFTNQFNRWYSDGKKIVPSDIEIDKDMLLWWYIGDGCLHRRKSRPDYRRVGLATNSFTKKDILNSINKLKMFLEEDSNIYEENNVIMIARKALCCFSSLFENSCPVNCYQYKFNFGQYTANSEIKRGRPRKECKEKLLCRK